MLVGGVWLLAWLGRLSGQSIAWLSESSPAGRALADTQRSVLVAPATGSSATVATLARPTAPRYWGMTDVIIVLALVLFSGFRYRVGTDYFTYYLLYNKLDTSNWVPTLLSAPQDIGFTLFSLVLRSLGLGEYGIFFASAALTVVPIYAVLKRRSSDLPFALLIYVLFAHYAAPLNLVRQGIAIALCFYAVMSSDRHPRRAAMLMLVAATFHSSALVVLFVFALRKRIRPSGWVWWSVIGGAAVLSATFSVLGGVAPLIAGLNARYEGYLVTNRAGFGTYLVIAVSLALAIYAYEIASRRGTLSQIHLLLIVGVGFQIVGTASIDLARIALYFTIFATIALPDAAGQVKMPALHKLVITGGGVVYYAFYLSSYGQLVPYQTIP